MIVEPLVQGAAGMQLQPRGYLRAVRSLCDRHDAFLICDEVATGFGRTGTMFACEQEDVVPDFLCLAKGLSGGYLPLAATLTTGRVHSALPRRSRRVPHLLPRPHVHRQPARLRSRARHARRVRGGAHAGAPAVRRWSCWASCSRDLVEPLAHVAEVRRRGFMCGIELAAEPRRGAPYAAGRPHGPPRDARSPRTRRDHPPARRRRGADAAALDRARRARGAGRDHRRLDRRRDRELVRPARRRASTPRKSSRRGDRSPARPPASANRRSSGRRT